MGSHRATPTGGTEKEREKKRIKMVKGDTDRETGREKEKE
jgi:hypothetical protein